MHTRSYHHEFILPLARRHWAIWASKTWSIVWLLHYYSELVITKVSVYGPDTGGRNYTADRKGFGGSRVFERRADRKGGVGHPPSPIWSRQPVKLGRCHGAFGQWPQVSWDLSLHETAFHAKSPSCFCWASALIEALQFLQRQCNKFSLDQAPALVFCQQSSLHTKKPMRFQSSSQIQGCPVEAECLEKLVWGADAAGQRQAWKGPLCGPATGRQGESQWDRVTALPKICQGACASHRCYSSGTNEVQETVTANIRSVQANLQSKHTSWLWS